LDDCHRIALNGVDFEVNPGVLAFACRVHLEGVQRRAPGARIDLGLDPPDPEIRQRKPLTPSDH
jgi:hypothetical protein